MLTASEVGEVLRWMRGVQGVPQEEAAASLGVSPELLRGLERGDRGVRFHTALEILARFGFDVVLVPRDSSLRLRDRSIRAAGTESEGRDRVQRHDGPGPPPAPEPGSGQ